MMTDILFTNTLMDSPNNNIIIVSKKYLSENHTHAPADVILWRMYLERHFMSWICDVCQSWTKKTLCLSYIFPHKDWSPAMSAADSSYAQSKSVLCIKMKLSHIILALEHSFSATFSVLHCPLKECARITSLLKSMKS